VDDTPGRRGTPVHRAWDTPERPGTLPAMDVSPERLRAAGLALRDLATDLGTPPRPATTGPGWATDEALAGLTATWQAALVRLAADLAETGARLIRAADDYLAADREAATRLDPVDTARLDPPVGVG
jgi:hypothetical protein